MAVERGCGHRKEGGVYACCGVAPDGLPIEHFFCDPPLAFDAAAIGLEPRGVTPIEIDGVWHILDWIGSCYYPNVADFLEEARRFGVSRRIPRNFNFAKLTRHSKLLCLHVRGRVENWEWQRWRYDLGCPKRVVLNHHAGVGFSGQAGHLRRLPPGVLVHETETPDPVCLGAAWHNIDPDRSVIEGDYVVMPSFKYLAGVTPAGFEPDYSLAIVLVCPINSLEVVGITDGTKAYASALAQVAGIPVTNPED